MFKATLIESKGYNILKHKELLFGLSSSIFIAFLLNLFSISLPIVIVLVVIMLVVLYFRYKNTKAIQVARGGNILEIDENEIRIKNQKGVLKESFEVDKLHKIALNKIYQIAPDTISEFSKQLKGRFKQNTIILYTKGKTRTLRFEVESHYMETQINKIKDHWLEKDLNIVTI